MTDRTSSADVPTTDHTSANEFIEDQLNIRLRNLETKLKSDVIAYVGPIIYGVDDVIRSAIEARVKNRPEPDKRLHVILTTQGGYIEVVQRIVETLRYHYPCCVGFVVPNQAFSAGTVFAMSGDEIYMDYYSRLGPIDPQVETADNKMVPALGYLVMYDRLLKRAKQNKLLTVEASILLGFDQAELYKYEQSRELSVALLIDWVVKYKFKDWTQTETNKKPVTSKMRAKRAEEIARALNDTKRWHSHGHGISMEVLRRDLQLRIKDFGADPELNDMIHNYQGLLDDYMTRLGKLGVVHTAGNFVSFM